MSHYDEITGLTLSDDQYKAMCSNAPCWMYIDEDHIPHCFFNKKTKALRWYLEQGRPENLHLIME